MSVAAQLAVTDLVAALTDVLADAGATARVNAGRSRCGLPPIVTPAAVAWLGGLRLDDCAALVHARAAVATLARHTRAPVAAGATDGERLRLEHLDATVTRACARLHEDVVRLIHCVMWGGGP